MRAFAHLASTFLMPAMMWVGWVAIGISVILAHPAAHAASLELWGGLWASWHLLCACPPQRAYRGLTSYRSLPAIMLGWASLALASRARLPTPGRRGKGRRQALPRRRSLTRHLRISARGACVELASHIPLPPAPGRGRIAALISDHVSRSSCAPSACLNSARDKIKGQAAQCSRCCSPTRA